jgi:hypothetical protein
MYPFGSSLLRVVGLGHKIPEFYFYKHSSEIKYSTMWSIFLSPLCCNLVISILKIKCNLLFHWELVECKLLHGRRLRAQVCGVANIHRVEIMLTATKAMPIALFLIQNQENPMWKQRLEAVSDLEGPHFNVGMAAMAKYAQYLFNLQHNTAITVMQQCII